MKNKLTRAIALALATLTVFAFGGCKNKTDYTSWEVRVYNDGEGKADVQYVDFSVTRNSKNIKAVWINVAKISASEVQIDFSKVSGDSKKTLTLDKKTVKDALKNDGGWIKAVDDWNYSLSTVRMSLKGNVTINEVGTPVVSKVRTLSKCVMIAGLCGLVLSVAVALILYFANDRIASVERVEAITGKKNIMCINANGKKNRKNDKTLLPMNLEKLADTLVFLKEGDNDKVYQIQSSISEEGKSTVTANLSISLGRIGKKVLVIECDFRKPHVHSYLGLDRHVGMTDYFKDEKTFDEVVKPTAFENVSAITCGSTMDNPTLLFMSHKFETLVAEAREKYDFVILDCAPVGRVSDYISVSRVADSAILVVGCEKVSSQTLKNTVSELKEAGAAVLGTVFNFTSRSRHGYGYYYYSDYGEEKKDK